jgi:hypothetical protein
MKNKTLLGIAARLMLTTTVSAQAAQVIDFHQLPPVVQQAINDQRGPAGILSVQKTYRFGAPLYDVRLDQPAPNDEFLVTEAGTLIDAQSVLGVDPRLTPARQVLFSALPLPIQNTIRAQLGNVPVANVDMITANGQTSYVVPGRINGELTDLWVDPNGNLLTLTPPRVLLSRPVRVERDRLPAAVQETLRTYAEQAPIRSVSRGLAHGQTVYDAIFDRDGHNMDLRIAEDGTLVRDAVNDRFLAETGRMTRLGLAANAPVRLPLAQPVSLSFNQVPLPVLSTIQRYAGADFVSGLGKGFLGGQPIYEATFNHLGSDTTLRMAADGSLLHDRVNEVFLAQSGQPIVLIPSAAVGAAPSWQSQTGGGASR